MATAELDYVLLNRTLIVLPSLSRVHQPLNNHLGLPERSNQIYSIRTCQPRLLRWSLRLYGFLPPQSRHSCTSKCCLYLHRVLIFIALCLGFYSLEGIQSNNHGSNYLATIVDVVYPCVFITTFLYLTQSNHFWKACSICNLTPYAVHYVTYGLLVGIMTSVAWASWQKLTWRSQHLDDQQLGDYTNVGFALWLLFYVTFLLRLYLLFVTAAVFWLIARFHKRQIKVYLRSIRSGELLQHKAMFAALIALKTDMDHSNAQLQAYLSVLLITLLVSLIVLVCGILFSFIEITVFINNASDLFLITAIAIYVSICAAQTTEEFNAIGSELTKYYHQRIAFGEWTTDRVIQFLLYVARYQSGFKLFGVLLDYGTVMRYSVLLSSSFLSTFGKRFYEKK